MAHIKQQRFTVQARIKEVWETKFPGMLKLVASPGWKDRLAEVSAKEINDTSKHLAAFHYSVKNIGAAAILDDYERRKLGIFNQLNFFQLITGIFIAAAGLGNSNNFPQWAWWVALLPSVISIAVLWLNARQQYEAALLSYFIFYPVMTSFVYMSGINMGNELFFVLYGILSVFFLQRISHMIFSVSLSMISYFMLAVVLKDHRFQLESSSMSLYMVNQITGVAFIFYGLFLIKKENMEYQASVLEKNREIAQAALLLEQQTKELIELNSLKNKLFSIIAHDLKTPMYSLRSLFKTMQQQNIPAKQIKAMLPDMIHNLNYTTGLMDNLLHWAKSQMQTEGAIIQSVDPAKITGDTIRLLSTQADAKQVTITAHCPDGLLVQADSNMIELVIRNLLSNAIKFTPENGAVVIGIKEYDNHAEVYITDNGRGIGAEALQKINGNNYFSTNGTAQEPGTGLGLMLCKEFLLKNNSSLCIQSIPGKGSTFSFSLQKTHSS